MNAPQGWDLNVAGTSMSPGPQCRSWDLNVGGLNVGDLNVWDLNVIAPSECLFFTHRLKQGSQFDVIFLYS